jgi:hypothetical protein
MNGFQTIPRIWQCPTYNYAHGVFQVRPGHFIPQIRWNNPLWGGAHTVKKTPKMQNFGNEREKTPKKCR